MNIELISTIVGVSAGAGVLFAGIGFAYAQFKSGGDKYKDNLIDTLKESITVLEDKNKKQAEERTMLISSHQSQLTELNKNLGILQGRFDEQTKQIDMYKQLLQGRDPEQLAVFKEIREVLKKIDGNSAIIQVRAENPIQEKAK